MGRLRALIFNSNGQSGYSLIGTALLILVIGIFSVAGIAVYKQYDWVEKNTVTNENIETLKAALAHYQSLEGRLPCPAPLNAYPTSAEFGVEECSAEAISGDRGEIRYGAVPVRTLSINEGLSFDGWQHRIVYAVTKYYTEDRESIDPLANRGAIFIVDGEGNNATETAGNVVYTLLAPGPDPRGAFTVSGHHENCGNGVAGENCNNDQTLVSSVIHNWSGGQSEFTSKLSYVAATASYEWRPGTWGECTCAVKTQNRDVYCYNRVTNAKEDDSLCALADKPTMTQNCGAQCWDYEGSCPSACGTPSIQQTAYCLQNDGARVANSLCQANHGAANPPTIQCNNPCPPPPPVYYGDSSSSSSGGGSTMHHTYVEGSGWITTTTGTDATGATTYHHNGPNAGHAAAQAQIQHSNGGGSSSSSSSSSSSGSSRVICTHFYRRGRLSRELWRADLEFTFNNLSWTTVRGYQFWGIPAVYLMRKYSWTEAIFWPLAINRAEEIAYQLGLRDKPNYKGKLIRLVMEPLCFLIGLFVPEQNWAKVHADTDKSIA